MINLCQTRWAQRNVAYQHFLDLYQFTIKTLENIAYSMPRDEYGEGFQDCKTDCKRKNGASLLLLGLPSFDFIICFKVVYICVTSCWYNCQASQLMHGHYHCI